MRKSIIALFLVASMVAGSLFAQKPFVVSKSGKKKTYDRIVPGKNGVLIAKRGSLSLKIKPSEYKSAWVPLNQAPPVAKMSKAYQTKQYAEVASLFKQAYPKYAKLGWGAYSVLLAAKALNNINKKSAAISTLELLDKMPESESEKKLYFKAKRLLTNLYLETDKLDKAGNSMKDLGRSQDDSVVAYANNARGDIYAKQGKTRDAVLEYAKTVLLFDKKNKVERPQALFKIVKIFRSEKNNQAKKFEKILREDYPNSKYLKSL